MESSKDAELRRLAETAAKTWQLSRYGISWYIVEDLLNELDAEDAAFIAAAAPARIVELLDEKRALVERVRELEARLHQHEGKYDASGLLKEANHGE